MNNFFSRRIVKGSQRKSTRSKISGKYCALIIKNSLKKIPYVLRRVLFNLDILITIANTKIHENTSSPY